MTVVDVSVHARDTRSSLFKAIALYSVRKIVLWIHLRRTRRQLAAMSDEALNDVGLTREAALGEAMRPFWSSDHS